MQLFQDILCFIYIILIGIFYVTKITLGHIHCRSWEESLSVCFQGVRSLPRPAKWQRHSSPFYVFLGQLKGGPHRLWGSTTQLFLLLLFITAGPNLWKPNMAAHVKPGHCYVLNYVPPKFVCWSPNLECLKMWLYLETGPLKILWIDCCPYKK